MDTIICKLCGRELPKQYFYIRKNGYTNGICKECQGHKPTKIAPEGFKMCGKCGNAYPKTDEYFNRIRGKYLSGWCKSCKHDWGVQYRIDHKDERLAKYREKHPPRPPAKTEEYYKQWRHDYWQAHKAHKTEYNKWYRETHPDYDKEWRLKNPDKWRAINQRCLDKRKQQSTSI